jgi:hypothetical protein
MVGKNFCLLLNVFDRALLRPFYSAFSLVGTGKKTRKLENVIRSDGNRRIELLGSHPGGS